jgi:hypothetical protein
MPATTNPPLRVSTISSLPPLPTTPKTSNVTRKIETSERLLRKPDTDEWTIVPKRQQSKTPAKNRPPPTRHTSAHLARRRRRKSTPTGPLVQLATETATPTQYPGEYVASDDASLTVAQSLLCKLAPLDRTAQRIHNSVPIDTSLHAWMRVVDAFFPTESTNKAIHMTLASPSNICLSSKIPKDTFGKNPAQKKLDGLPKVSNKA